MDLGRLIYKESAGTIRVLVVEDETTLADAVARGLRRHGMNVDVAYDGDDGYGKASSPTGRTTEYVLAIMGESRA